MPTSPMRSEQPLSLAFPSRTFSGSLPLNQDAANPASQHKARICSDCTILHPMRQGPRARLATFESYGDSLRSFGVIAHPFAQGVGEPTAFATALQNSGKFGIDTETGRKRADYVPGVAATIRGLRPIIGRHGA